MAGFHLLNEDDITERKVFILAGMLLGICVISQLLLPHAAEIRKAKKPNLSLLLREQLDLPHLGVLKSESADFQPSAAYLNKAEQPQNQHLLRKVKPLWKLSLFASVFPTK